MEAVDYIPVHIGADALKRTLYDAVIPRWNRWTNNFPLCIDQITMRDRLWVILKPNVPDRDVIARNFFKVGKKGAQTFKGGKAIIHFHVPNEIYTEMLEKREKDELAAEKRGRKESARDEIVSSRMAADFTVGVLMHLQTISLICKILRLPLTKGRNEPEVSHLYPNRKIESLLKLRSFPQNLKNL